MSKGNLKLNNWVPVSFVRGFNESWAGAGSSVTSWSKSRQSIKLHATLPQDKNYIPATTTVGFLKWVLGNQTQVLILAKPALYWLKYFPPQLFNTLYLNNPNKPQIDFASLIIEFKIPTIYLNMGMETNTTTPSE